MMQSTSSLITKYVFCTAIGFLVCFSGCHAQEVGDGCQATPDLRGTCVSVAECQEESKELIRRGRRPVVCGFRGIQPIVCCSRKDGGNAEATAAPAADGDKARKYCNEYKFLCPDYGKKSNESEFALPLVVGGEPAKEGEFPHMAAVGYETDEGVVWGCGATLISYEYVLTAAHCLTDPIRGPARLVLLGAVFIEDALRVSDTGASEGQIHRVLERISHPDYKQPEKYNDIALLKIEPGPSGAGDGAVTSPNAPRPSVWAIRPACLHYDGDFKLKEGKAVATGWGRLGFGEEVTPQLQKVSLTVFDNAVCNESFEVEIRTTSQLPKGINPTLICAGELEGGMDTCVGDSGGPLQVTNFEDSCLGQVIGVTSFGRFCGFQDSPSVYTRVKNFVPWIESVVWP